MSNNRMKLETAIEREAYKLVNEIKEHSYDFTMLYVRRNNLNIDGEVLRVVLDITNKAVMDGFQRNIDKFMKNLDETLLEFSDKENPTASSGESKQKRK